MSAKGYLPTKRQIAEHRKIWNELILNMADGDLAKANEIKKMDAIREFWQYFDFWRAKQQKKIEEIKHQNQQRR